jgi:hypothetical protein
MKQPKWIESIEATDHWEPGYWVQRGWNKLAQMHATSVIDTVAVDMAMIGANQNKVVPIGGIAACRSARNFEGRSAGGQRLTGRSRAERAAVALDLGYLEI